MEGWQQFVCATKRRCVLTLGSGTQALLKKHEALMSDLTAYGSSIQALKEQAQSCRVSLIVPSSDQITSEVWVC